MTRLLELGWRAFRILPPGMAWSIFHRIPWGVAKLVAFVDGRPAEWEEGEYSFLGVRLPNPVGLAAGLDKDGRFPWISWAMGFGFHVVGSILPHPNEGVKPKILVRLPDGGTINRLGLPSPGVEVVVDSLRRPRPRDLAIAGSIAAFTPEGYSEVYERISKYVDWVEINISCPNVREHRSFEEPEMILSICRHLKKRDVPILLKIPPTRDTPKLEEYLMVSLECGFAGIVAANTRPIIYRGYNSGLGGPKLYDDVRFMVRFLRDRAPSNFRIVAVGGIDSTDKALEVMELGADLIELLSAIVSKGPSVVSEIVRAVTRR